MMMIRDSNPIEELRPPPVICNYGPIIILEE